MLLYPVGYRTGRMNFKIVDDQEHRAGGVADQ